MLWIPIAAGSYFLSGFSAAIDKFLLSRRIPSPAVYAFYVGILSVTVIWLAVFDFSFLSPFITLMALLAGAFVIFAYYFFYVSLQKGEASVVVPLVGAATPLFLVLLESIFVREPPSTAELFAILFFILGGALLSYNPENHLSLNYAVLSFSLLAALFFALGFYLTKEVFLSATFINGFVWTRLGSVLGALLFLISSSARRDIFHVRTAISRSSVGIFFANKGIGALGFFILHYAIFLGPVSIINAMKSLEHLFILIIALASTYFAPYFIKEAFDIQNLFRKVLGVIFIAVGFGFLFFA